MYLLTEWEGQTEIFGWQGLHAMNESQIFSHPAQPNLVN